MKCFWIVFSLVVSAGTLNAQPGDLYNAELIDHSNVQDPAVGAEQVQDGWFVFSVPAISGSKSPCCWRGAWDGTGESGCSLKQEQHSFGTRSDSPDTNSLLLYTQVTGGGVTDIRVMGEQCPVDANGESVSWFGEVDTQAGLEWLRRLAVESQTTEVPHSALFALGRHENPGATNQLTNIALAEGVDVAEQAVFWLGEARGASGYKALVRLLTDLPKGEARHAIPFALSLNDTAAAVKKLEDLAVNAKDREIRGQSMFWLAESHPERAEPIVMAVIRDGDNEDLLDEAVFALSQLPGDRSGKALMAVARDQNQSRHARQQALFWLANSDDDNVDALIELITN